jgi:hypothetical protein
MKQAVVLIHGIGEQVPMDTLRGFVRAVWTTDENVRNPWNPDQVWSKPDTVSHNYELRRLTTAEGKTGKRTDFFELYWADLMEGTEVQHLTAWLKLLLLRSPAKVPVQLRGLWWTMAILTVGLPLLFVLWKLEIITLSGFRISILSGAGTVLWLAAGGFLRSVAGDAARYLHVAPANIGRRRAIREAGIELLDRLHQSADYDRIILVGHSLGSVIGYDILTHLWPKYNTGHAGKGSGAALDPLEVLAAKSDLAAGEYQPEQNQYAQRLKTAGNKWLVTDFVTVGSPLAHASFLLTRKPEEFNAKKTERELPACPPILEKVKGQQRFCYPLKQDWVPNHAAVFAPTRWTNLFFPCVATVFGDVIGGPVRPMFGRGVQDVPLRTTIRGGLFTHTAYWSFPAGWDETMQAPTHIQALRDALRLAD